MAPHCSCAIIPTCCQESLNSHTIHNCSRVFLLLLVFFFPPLQWCFHSPAFGDKVSRNHVRPIKTQEASVPELLPDLVSFRRLRDSVWSRWLRKCVRMEAKCQVAKAARVQAGWFSVIRPNSRSSPVESRWNAGRTLAHLSRNSLCLMLCLNDR